jgi:exonuclease VII small subunit
MTLPPEKPPPDTMTDGMRWIADKIRRTPPAEREAVERSLQPFLAQEQAKVAQQHELHKDYLVQRRALELKQQDQMAAADKDRREAQKAAQERVTAPEQAPSDPQLLGTERSPQRTGPRIEPVPPGDIPERWVKQEAEKIAKTKDSYEKAKPELTETVDIINKIRAHPAKPYATGMFSGITAATPQGKGFVALNEQLMGKNLVDAYQKLQGTGQIGEKEGANFAKARARLTTATTEKDYDDALQDLETTVRGTLERAQRNLKMPVTAYQKTPDDDYAPDVGEIGKRGGRVVEYIGGDPSKDSSYRARTPR